MTIPELTASQWTLALVGALFVGLGKGGLPGIGNLAIAFYALAFPAKASVGILLPVLIAGDIVAVAVYWRHAQWGHVVRLFPWTAGGVVLGWLLLDQLSNEAVARLMGVLLLAMTVFHFWRQAQTGTPREPVRHLPAGFTGTLGVLAGFSTMLANAAGPLASIYLMSSGLLKLPYIGTAAVFFFVVNVFKLPFQAEIGILTGDSLLLSLMFAPAAILGGLVAPWIVRFISQRLFGTLVWVFVIVAAVRLLF